MAIGEVKNKTPNYYTFSIVFLVCIIIVTALIFAYKYTVSQKNEALTSDITDVKTLIAAMREDKDVQAFELYEANKNKLEELAYLSNIPKFQTALNTISRNYNVEFQNFSYAKGVISVLWIAGSDGSEDAYEKLRSLIEDFRAQDDAQGDGENKNFIFDLEFVEAFAGSKDIKASLNFEVKPELKEQPKVQEKQAIQKALEK